MSVTNGEQARSASDVIEDIKRQIDSGYGVVPLIGSGMSVAAGIPAGVAYRWYLFHCLKTVFERRWDPQGLYWPHPQQFPRLQGGHDGLRNEIWAWVRACTKSESPREPARLEALGAAFDWRATLHLLSRLSVKGPSVELGEPRERVQDSFFAHLTRERVPSTAHMLLAHLADVLRTRLILTTNFDDLIEQAFRQLDMPIATYPVHHDTGLPDAGLVRAQRSLIKLHGGRYGLRADVSLDRRPRHEDCETFTEYLKRFDADRLDKPERNRRHLLIMGVSGADSRTTHLLRHAHDELTGVRVYWLCHTRLEAQHVLEQFGQWDRDRFWVAQTPDLGLFLLSLYERIFRCLPPCSVPFNATWPVSPGLLVDRRTEVDEGRTEIQGEGAEYLMDEASATRQYDSLSESRHCIWFAVSETFDDVGGAFAIVDALARRAGVRDLLPISPELDWVAAEAELSRRYERVRRHSFLDCAVFLRVPPTGRAESVSRVIKWLVERHVTVVVCNADKQADQVVEGRVDAWLQAHHARPEYLRFALGLTLFRLPPYYSALLSWAMIRASRALGDDDNDQWRETLAAEIVDSLRAAGFLRHDDGLSIALRDDAKRVLSRRLKDLLPLIEKAAAHQGIADWYMKLFRTCQDVEAALESMNHRLDCILAAADVADDERERLITFGLNELATSLELIRPRVLDSLRLLAAREAVTLLVSKLKLALDANRLSADHHRRLTAFERHFKLLHARFSATSSGRSSVSPSKATGTSESTSRVEDVESSAPLADLNRLVVERRYTETERQCVVLLGTLELLGQLKGWTTEDGLRLDQLQPMRGEAFRAHVRPWGLVHSMDDVKQAVVVFRRMQSLRLYQFELHLWNGECTKAHREAVGKRYLLEAEAFCTYAAELMRFLTDIRFLERHGARLRTSMGICLSWRGRHQESQRRYSEAYSHLSYLTGASLPRRFATVDLGRAVTFLSQLFEVAKPFRERKHYGLLYDAISSIERAAYKVRDRSVNARWLAWLYETELWACVNVAWCKEPRRFAWGREPAGLAARFYDSLERGLDLAGEDPVRLARYMQLFHDFEDAPRVHGDGAPNTSNLPLRQRLTERLRQASADAGMDTSVRDYVKTHNRL